MKIAIIGAMEKEVIEYRNIYDMKLINQAKKLYIGSCNDNEIYLIESGIGKVNSASTTQYMIDKYDIDIVISSGCAGSLTSSVRVFDTIISNYVTYHDFYPKRIMEISTPNNGLIKADDELIEKAKEVLENRDAPYHIGNIASGDCFVTDGNERDSIFNETEALAVDMESASIGHICADNKVPFISLRVISDFADGASEEEEKAARIASLTIVDLINNL
ncbi:MAG: 5'-methylthioadenosine/S-adenosylhomocysteine nucleosidase [Bacilli bacterium]|nr:5'-methylthioadenosine/S-adenosylhomocysteine nucleosidase [Bacilli bacterium]